MKQIKLKKISVPVVISFVCSYVFLYLIWTQLQFQNNVVLFFIVLSILLPIADVAVSLEKAFNMRMAMNRADMAFAMQVTEKGTMQRLLFRLQNKGILPIPGVRILFTLKLNRMETNTESMVDYYGVPGMKTTEVVFPILPVHCGILEARLNSIEIKDWIGLVRWSAVQGEQYVRTYVYPAKLRVGFEPEENSGGNDEDVNPLEEKGYVSSDIKEIREYIPGDRLQAIHWKLSAKAGELMVKEYESMSADHFQIVPEPDGSDMERFDKCSEYLYSLGMKLLEEREMGFSIYLYSRTERNMVQVAVREESDLLRALILMYENTVETESFAGRICLEQYRTFHTTGTGYILYLTTTEGDQDGEKLFEENGVFAYKVLA